MNDYFQPKQARLLRQLLPGGVISQHEGEHQRGRQEAVCEEASFRPY